MFSGYCQRYCQRRPKTLRLRLIALWPNANVTIQTNPRRKKESACCGHTPGVEMLQFLGTFPFLNMSFATPILCDSFHAILKDYWIIRLILLCRQDWSDDLYGHKWHYTSDTSDASDTSDILIFFQGTRPLRKAGATPCYNNSWGLSWSMSRPETSCWTMTMPHMRCSNHHTSTYLHMEFYIYIYIYLLIFHRDPWFCEALNLSATSAERAVHSVLVQLRLRPEARSFHIPKAVDLQPGMFKWT